MPKRKDMPPGFDYPGTCSRCGATPGVACDDWYTPRSRAKTQSPRTPAYYCIVRCHDVACNVFWYKGRIHMAPAGETTYTDVAMSLEQACSQFISFWEYAPQASNAHRYLQWYRGRYFGNYPNISWFSLNPSPFPVSRYILYSDIDTHAQYTRYLTEEQLSLNFKETYV